MLSLALLTIFLRIDCLFRTAKLLVCIGDCGITPLEAGIPSNPQIKTCTHYIYYSHALELLSELKAVHGINYHDTEDEDIIVVGRWISEVVLLLLSHLRGNIVIKEVESGDHQSWYNSCDDVGSRNLNQILLFSNPKNKSVLFSSVLFCSVKWEPYLDNSPVVYGFWIPGKRAELTSGNSRRDSAWNSIRHKCPKNDHQRNTVICCKTPKPSCSVGPPSRRPAFQRCVKQTEGEYNPQQPIRVKPLEFVFFFVWIFIIGNVELFNQTLFMDIQN